MCRSTRECLNLIGWTQVRDDSLALCLRSAAAARRQILRPPAPPNIQLLVTLRARTSIAGGFLGNVFTYVLTRRVRVELGPCPTSSLAPARPAATHLPGSRVASIRQNPATQNRRPKLDCKFIAQPALSRCPGVPIESGQNRWSNQSSIDPHTNGLRRYDRRRRGARPGPYTTLLPPSPPRGCFSRAPRREASSWRLLLSGIGASCFCLRSSPQQQPTSYPAPFD